MQPVSKTQQSQLVSKQQADSPDEQDESRKEVKTGRNWHTISNKVDAKALAAVEVGDYTEENKETNLEAEMEKYLGGDDEVLEGFFDSGDEVNFDSINLDKKASTQSLFGRLTSAFKSVTGNKVLTVEDMEPILKDFAQMLMDKNVAQEVAEDICRKVQARLLDQRTQTFTSVKATINKTLSESIQSLLTPKRNIDILKEALAAK